MKYLIPLLSLPFLMACQERAINGDDLSIVGNTPNYDQNGQYIAPPYGQNPIVQPVYDENGQIINQVQTPQFTGSIESNPNQIVLSDYTQEQQKRDREAYARQLEAIAAQRVEITEANVPQSSGVNVAAYARSTTNQVGEKIYSRKGKRGSCRFPTNDAAQRAFLENGGPINDPLGLDADGDGFACKFDPSLYRSIR